jgi:hypothetical protein
MSRKVDHRGLEVLSREMDFRCVQSLPPYMTVRMVVLLADGGNFLPGLPETAQSTQRKLRPLWDLLLTDLTPDFPFVYLLPLAEFCCQLQHFFIQAPSD